MDMNMILNHYGPNPSQGKEEMNLIPFLSLDIILQILILLPADFLQNTCKFVCKAWAELICHPSFIKAHLANSKSGLYIHEYGVHPASYFLEMEGATVISHLRNWVWARPVDSCRGCCLLLVPCSQRITSNELLQRPDWSHSLYIMNPSTMKMKALPSFVSGSVQSCHLSYIVQTGQYIVICLLKDSGILHGILFTVGIDVWWRRLNLPRGEILDTEDHTSAFVEQVFYLSASSTKIVSIDLLNGSNCSMMLPDMRSHSVRWLLKMEENLCCIVPENMGMTAYLLKNSRNNEWVKHCHIGEAIARNLIPLFSLAPVGWLDKGRILVLMTERGFGVVGWKFCCAVNVETWVATPLFNHYSASGRDVVIHKDSLVKV